MESFGTDFQTLPADTPPEDVIALLKGDGEAFVNGLVATEDVQRAHDDVEWDGNVLPSMFINPSPFPAQRRQMKSSEPRD